MRRRFDFLSVLQKLQKRVGVVIRFTITVSVACSTATFSNWFQYESYWNGTIFAVQTVDFNLLSHTLPTKLSYVLQQNNVIELQRTLNSNYGLFGLVVTDCKTDEKNCSSEKILYVSKTKRNWKKALRVEDLYQHPYDILRNPPPILAEGKYGSPKTKQRHTTGQKNLGAIIGRVYYIRGIPPSFTYDFFRWLNNPLSISGSHKYYSEENLTLRSYEKN